MSNNSNTITSLKYNACKSTGVDYVSDPTLTLNTYLGSEEQGIPLPENYHQGFVVIGNNGYEEGVDPLPDNVPIDWVPPRNNTLGVLYHAIPFRMVQESNDLSAQDRFLYGLRVKHIINGINYVAYYAKYSWNPSDLEITRRNLETGVSNSNIKPFMHPIRRTPDDTQDQLTVSTSFSVSITQEDIEGAKLFCELVYGNEDHGVIREIGLCMGGFSNTPIDMVGLELLSSANIGQVQGITVPSDIDLSIGRTDLIIGM